MKLYAARGGPTVHFTFEGIPIDMMSICMADNSDVGAQIAPGPGHTFLRDLKFIGDQYYFSILRL
jgi:hypothetical protein